MPGHCWANLRAFPKPKSAEKGALIADLRLLNSLMGSPPVPFELPSLEQLAGLLEICKARGISTCYTKLDISNMFWFVQLPPQYANSFRFRVRGITYAIPSLPFGWTHSPTIAVAVLAQYLAVTFPGDIIIIQYVDDILLVAADRTALARCTHALARDLECQGWRVSPKSQLDPSMEVSWMGKDLHGGRHTIIQSANYMATVTALWVRLATHGYDARTMRRLCGKIIRASRPGRGAMPFMNGALAWLNWGPHRAMYTPPAVLRGLMEATAVCLTPWTAPAPVTGPAEQWFVDAAFDAGHWTAALWAPDRGARIWKLPPYVRTQQGAELAAIEAAVRLAAYERLSHVRLVADNMAAIWATKRTKASMANPERARHLRRIQHLLRWSHLRVHMYWVASRFNPADSPSRMDKYESAVHMMADAEATYQTLRKLPQHKPLAMGWVHYRG